MGLDIVLFERLDALTNKANTALLLATGEWICERYALVNDDPMPLQFLEAAWAGTIHPAYCTYTETVDNDWRGPIRSPLAVTIAIANDALFCLHEDPHVATRACWMYKLAHHVLPNLNLFNNWFDVCATRLEQCHSKSVEAKEEEDLFSDFPSQGHPVPREALDPGFDYNPKDSTTLLDSFLRGLDPGTNPFLRTVGELMNVPELQGTPYILHLPK